MRATLVRPLPVILLVFGLFLFVSANNDIIWPKYNQQCRDDAGPPYVDDEESFGVGKKYHDGSAAVPILQDGACAPRMKKACSERPTTKTAYLEGPIDCGDQGWYCRIFKEEGWNNVNLRSDYNFGHCNTTENFNDAGIDIDGHCHGSTSDNTYYWWIRDHWHRQYNGRVRCCCGWFTETATADISPEPLYKRRIANRCDYRRLVTKEENLDNCRDANEDHNMGFDDIGCDPQYSDQIGTPIPEDDGSCWEISKFGFVDNDDNDDNEAPTPSPPEPPSDDEAPSPGPPSDDEAPTPGSSSDDEAPTPGSSSDDEECTENPRSKFMFRRNGEKLEKNCSWLGSRKKKLKRRLCKNNRGPKKACRITCKKCAPNESVEDSTSGSDEDNNSDQSDDPNDENEDSGDENEGSNGNVFILD